MPKLRTVRDALHAACILNMIDDDKFLLLYDLNQSNNPSLPYCEYNNSNLNEISKDECKAEFRFKKDDIYAISTVIGMPEELQLYNSTRIPSVEAFCILLKRLAYPCRYSDMVPRFARPVPQLCMISNYMLEYIYCNWGWLLSNFAQRWLAPQNLERYARAVHEKGAALKNCWGFVDGTVRPVSRSSRNQRILYNGNKRVRPIKFQSVVAADRLIANLYGPVEGRRHDSAMLTMYGLLGNLQESSYSPGGEALCVYEDPPYPHRVHLQAPFKGARLTDGEIAFNMSMSRVRVAVEWLFGDIVSCFKFLDFKRSLKVGLSPVGKMYIVCALLWNAHTCLYGNNTSNFSGIAPPCLDEYFQCIPR